MVWWSNIIFLHIVKTGCFSGGLDTPRRRHVTSSRVRQGLDTSRRYRLQVRQQV